MVSHYYGTETPLPYIRNLKTQPFFLVAGALEIKLLYSGGLLAIVKVHEYPHTIFPHSMVEGLVMPD